MTTESLISDKNGKMKPRIEIERKKIKKFVVIITLLISNHCKSIERKNGVYVLFEMRLPRDHRRRRVPRLRRRLRPMPRLVRNDLGRL